jgi:hypothetical protein
MGHPRFRLSSPDQRHLTYPQDTFRLHSSIRRYSWFHTHSHTQPFPPPIPLPAAIRPTSRPSSLPLVHIHSSPELLHSAPSTPTSAYSPGHDFKAPDLWRVQVSDDDLHNLSQRSLIQPTRNITLSDVLADDVALRVPGSQEYSTPPSTEEIHTWISDDSGRRGEEARSAEDMSSAVVRGESPVWNRSMDYEDGVQVWRAI